MVRRQYEMEYFLMQQDKRYSHPPFILDVFNNIDKRHICKERFMNISPITVLYVKPDAENQYLDVLDRQMFLVSEEVKKLLEKYEPYLKFKIIALIDKENSKTTQYYLPILDKIDCLSEKSQLNLDRSVVKKIVLKEDNIGDKSIFKLDGVSTTYVIVRLDLAESILRRDFIGIKLTRVEVE